MNKRLILILCLILIVPTVYGLSVSFGEWSGLSQQRYLCQGSSDQAYYAENEAVVEIYSARTARWRGAFSVHSWITLKTKDSDIFKRYEVIGWYFKNNSHVSKSLNTSDHYWYGYKPKKLFSIHGPKAETLIKKIEHEVATYPYKSSYTAWPGPNSNTFVAFIIRNIPEINIELPVTAVGKDYYKAGWHITQPPSNSGFQISYSGIFSLIVSAQEGVELNIGGAVWGIDFNPFAIKIFSVGRIGFDSDFSADFYHCPNNEPPAPKNE